MFGFTNFHLDTWGANASSPPHQHPVAASGAQGDSYGLAQHFRHMVLVSWYIVFPLVLFLCLTFSVPLFFGGIPRRTGSPSCPELKPGSGPWGTLGDRREPKGAEGSRREETSADTIWLFNIAMENGPFIDGLPIKNCDFPEMIFSDDFWMISIFRCCFFCRLKST